jgi:pRiA4b ORF-3-like protein/SEC-C motif-containing protein
LNERREEYMKLQRNEKCPCNSGKKYKKCCYTDPKKNKEIIRAASMATSWKEMAEILSKPICIYRLKVILTRMKGRNMEEEISRTFDMKGNHTLFNFHNEIQCGFDWDYDHMFSFYFGGKLYDAKNEYSASPLGEHLISDLGPPSKSAVEAQIRDLGLSEGSEFIYLFDYGDELVHEVTVEKIYNNDDVNKKFPATVNKTGTPPPQYEPFEFE